MTTKNLHFMNLFPVDGYTILIENEENTCHDAYRIATKENHGVSQCRSFCNENNICKYFYVNDGKWCVLYVSCIEKRVAGHKGSTFKKAGK